MKLIIKDRGKGKTTGLIYTSESTGYPIVVHNEIAVNNVKDMAAKMGCEIPEPITMTTLKNGKLNHMNHRYGGVLIDNVDFILEAALNEYFGCAVQCATMSYSLNKHSNLSKGED